MTDGPKYNEQAQAYLEKLRKIVVEKGLAVQHVGGEQGVPGFSYTIGLWPAHAELLLIGVPPAYSQLILNGMAAHIKSGFVLELGRTYPADENNWVSAPVRFIKADPTMARTYARMAFHYHGAVMPEVIQMVVPDPAGRFWDDPLYDHEWGLKMQPVLITSLH